MADPQRNEKHEDVRYEHRDVNVRGVVRFIFGLVTAAVLIYLAVTWVFDNLNARQTLKQKNVSVFRSDSSAPREPRLQPMPGHPEQATLEMQALLRNQDSILGNICWIDRANGIIKIPISIAKEIIIKRGSSMEGKP